MNLKQEILKETKALLADFALDVIHLPNEIYTVEADNLCEKYSDKILSQAIDRVEEETRKEISDNFKKDVEKIKENYDYWLSPSDQNSFMSEIGSILLKFISPNK